MATSVVAAIVLLTGPAAAQTPSDTLDADTTVYTVQGVTASVARPATTTGGASAVEADLDSLAVPPAPTLEQVLREMPLIQIRRNSRGQAQPALRGSDGRQVAVLVDGIPLTLGWDHRTDLSVIPLTAARSITLLRGLSSVLHGPNVLGGVVEIDVARGSVQLPPPEPLSLSAGIEHTGGRSLGLTGGTLLQPAGGRWSVRGGFGYREQPGFTLPDFGDRQLCPQDVSCAAGLITADGDLRLNTDVERFDGFLATRYLADAGHWFSLAASGYRVERGVAPEIHTSDPRLWRYPYQSRYLAALTGGTGQRVTLWGTGDLEASFGVDIGRTEIDEFATSEYREVTGGESSDDRTLTLRLLGDHTLTSRGELRGALTFADISHDEVLEPGGAASYRQRLWSAGAEVEWRFRGLAGLPGFGLTRVSLGGAIDGADTPESGGKPPLDRLWDWGARLGATSMIADGTLLLHGGLSRRARFPALRELYSGALGRFVPNPSLTAEVLVAGEAGFTLQARGAEFQAVGFHQRLSDAITRSAVSTPEGEKFQRVNRDEIRGTGLELLGLWSGGGYSLTGDITLQRVRLIDPDAGTDLEAEYEPAYAGKLGVGVPLPLGAEGTADMRYRGSQFCVNPTATGGQQRIDASTSLDLGLRRLFRWLEGGTLSRVDALLALENVTDAAVFDQCGLPQPGRTLRLQVRLW